MGHDQQQFFDELSAFEERFRREGPELEMTVRDHSIGLEGYVVVWNSAPGRRGPLGPMGKGGTRITARVTLEEIAMLSQRMALKNGAAGLPMGGAKSGIRADPDAPDFERLYRRFAQCVAPMLRERGGIFGGFGFDIGARPEHPIWICDELESLRCFTGKPFEMGGTDYDREGIAGLGVAVAARTAIELRGEAPGAVRCAIQGMGAMGAAVFRYLREFGIPVVAIADLRLGGCYRLPPEISPELAHALINQNFVEAKTLLDRESLDELALDDILFLDLELVVPCAVQDVITASNQGQMRARYVIEGANNPTSRAAQELLEKRAVFVVPDFVANPGGIIAAYVELSSNISPAENLQTRAKTAEAKRMTEERIAANVRAIHALAAEHDVSFIDAGRLIAFRNMYDVGGD